MFQASGAKWRKLDNAAKIFPATSGKRDTRVFRFSCELKEDIDGMLLQRALDQTMEHYPMFCSVMRKGAFWYYLEKSSLRPMVREEYKAPCSSIYIRDQKSLLFEVTYYHRRINFEVFHALTDGTGASQFIRELAVNYLALSHPGEVAREPSPPDRQITEHDREDDSFAKYYSGTRERGKRKKIHSYQLRGLPAENGNTKLVEGCVSARTLVEKAREYGVSVTVLLTAVFFCAVHREMSPRKMRYPVVLMVPVNLRNFFPSDSVLNFFGWIEPGYCFEEQGTEFEKVLIRTKEFFKEELTTEKVAAHMNSLMSLEKNPLLRIVPLELKNLFIQAGARMAKNDVTAVFSNMGVMEVPECCHPYIERFQVFTSTPKMELCTCSFRDQLVLSFTSRFENINIQRNFFRILEDLGVPVEVLEPEYPPLGQAAYGTRKLFEWVTFLCIAAAVVCGMCNVILTPGRSWGIGAAAGIFCTWAVFAVGFFKRRNLLKNAMYQLVLVTALSVIWDMAAGWRGWSVTWVYPAANLLTLGFMGALTAARRLKAMDYMIYYFMAAISGLIPLVLLMTGNVTEDYPSVICGGISFLCLSALMIFRRKAFVSELSKKFHL